MNLSTRSLLIIILMILIQCSPNIPSSESIDYFNQQPPGIKPELFAAEIFSNTGHRLHGFPAFSPDGKEIYWPVIPPKILYIQKENNRWFESEMAPFSEGNIQAPIFSINGKQLFFQMSDPEGYGSLDIWYVERADTGWSIKKNIGSPPNSDQIESQPSFTKNGTIYFTGYYEKGLLNRGIYKSRYINNKYEKPQLLPGPINTKYLDYTPFISPDENYLLFSSTRPSSDEEDIRIFISFRNRDDSWTVPKNLNDAMDFDQPSRFPYLTPDGKFIIFQSNENYYWVSSKIIYKCE